MLAYHSHSFNLKKSSSEVTDVSIMLVDVLNEGVMSTLKQRFPDLTEVHMAKNVFDSGIRYSEVMLIVHGSIYGLPKFNKIIKLCIL